VHGSKSGEFAISVLISDPSAKAKREGNTKIMVKSLTQQTTEADVREQFEKVSPGGMR
jgi:hypothetical protein